MSAVGKITVQHSGKAVFIFLERIRTVTQCRQRRTCKAVVRRRCKRNNKGSAHAAGTFEAVICIFDRQNSAVEIQIIAVEFPVCAFLRNGSGFNDIRQKNHILCRFK